MWYYVCAGFANTCLLNSLKFSFLYIHLVLHSLLFNFHRFSMLRFYLALHLHEIGTLEYRFIYINIWQCHNSFDFEPYACILCFELDLFYIFHNFQMTNSFYPYWVWVLQVYFSFWNYEFPPFKLITYILHTLAWKQILALNHKVNEFQTKNVSLKKKI